MSKHPKKVGQYTNMDKLAEDIGNLHYETLELLMIKLSNKLDADAWVDGVNGRAQLSEKLFEASKGARAVSTSIGKAFKISEPYMKEIDPIQGCALACISGCNTCIK
jgi:hypothetical protein